MREYDDLHPTAYLTTPQAAASNVQHVDTTQYQTPRHCGTTPKTFQSKVKFIVGRQCQRSGCCGLVTATRSTTLPLRGFEPSQVPKGSFRAGPNAWSQAVAPVALAVFVPRDPDSCIATKEYGGLVVLAPKGTIKLTRCYRVST